MINPKRALEKFENFIKDYKERVKKHISVYSVLEEEARKAILEKNESLEQMAVFYEEAINTFKEFKIYNGLMQEHEESITYFKKNIAPYL